MEPGRPTGRVSSPEPQRGFATKSETKRRVSGEGSGFSSTLLGPLCVRATRPKTREALVQDSDEGLVAGLLCQGESTLGSCSGS